PPIRHPSSCYRSKELRMPLYTLLLSLTMVLCAIIFDAFVTQTMAKASVSAFPQIRRRKVALSRSDHAHGRGGSLRHVPTDQVRGERRRAVLSPLRRDARLRAGRNSGSV